MVSVPESASEYLFVLAILASVAVAWITNRGQRQQRRDLAEVRNQVTNTHDTNLRDDLDEMHRDIRGLRQDVGELRGEVREVRGQVRDSREQQSEFESGVRAFVRRTHPGEVV
ncbi:DUF2746 domain-containing protein [Nocardia brasiliensis]|uniref:DUF2746 domain-containing protein n=1 Tax=Nocardia brasiliensis TaxID=37326 RepID=UPI00245538C6|nr:DUF2746 domain-containing protein [Nocardia brasiliensis]